MITVQSARAARDPEEAPCHALCLGHRRSGRRGHQGRHPFRTGLHEASCASLPPLPPSRRHHDGYASSCSDWVLPRAASTPTRGAVTACAACRQCRPRRSHRRPCSRMLAPAASPPMCHTWEEPHPPRRSDAGGGAASGRAR